MKATEGKATVSISKGVFFNPNMKQLRDISVAFIRAMKLEKPSLLDCTSATGIRGIRYAKEAGVSDITLLDINKKAAENTRKNIKANKIKAKVLNADLQDFAIRHEGKFDLIDLDPFGTPAPYLYDVLKVSRDGTILMVTATDTAVLCGAHTAACVKQYGSMPLHNHLCKEVGIRILINHIIRKAAEFNYGVEVLVSISDMHYMRVFVRLGRGAKKAYESMMQSGFGTYCPSCSSFGYASGIAPKVKGKCGACGGNTQQFGPLFLGRLNDKSVLSSMLEAGVEYGIAEKTLKTLYGEYETPFFYFLPKITRLLKTSSVSFASVCDNLAKKGYECSHTLFDKEGIKTNAPAEEVTDTVKVSKAKQPST